MDTRKINHITGLLRAVGADPGEPHLLSAYNACRLLISLRKGDEPYTANVGHERFKQYARAAKWWEQESSLYPAIDALCGALEQEQLCDTHTFMGLFAPYACMDSAAFHEQYRDEREYKELSALTLLLIFTKKLPVNGSGLDDIDALYGRLCAHISPKALENMGLGRDGFAACWQAIRSCAIENIPAKANGRINRAIKSYRQKMVPLSRLVGDLADIKVYRRNLEKALNPWQYLNRGIKQLPVEGGMTVSETLFETAAFALKDELPTDVIRAAFYPPGRNDSGLELDFVLEKFAGLAYGSPDILIVNPSPDVILRRYKGDRLFQGVNTGFAVTDKTLAALYKTQFPETTFIAIEELSDLPYSVDGVLIFARDLERDMLKQALSALDKAREGAVIMALLPNAAVDSREFGFRSILRNASCRVEDIFVLPGEASRSNPRKKALLTLSKGAEAASDAIPMYSGRVEGTRLYLAETTNVARSSFESGKYSLKALQKGADKQKNVTHRNSPREYVFSREISLWYTFYANRKNSFAAKAYYSETLIDNRAGRLKGKSITESTERGLRHKTVEGVMAGLEALPFDQSFQEAIIGDILAAYSDRKEELSLKTVWFCCRPALMAERSYDDGLARELFCGKSKGLGMLCPQTALAEDYRREMEAALNQGAAVALKYWYQLDHILRVAVREGYARYNPIYELLARISDRATKEQREVRNALTKKSLTSEENRRLMDFLRAGTKLDFGPRNARRYEAESIWLAGAIRLFTGMAPREVCALTWRDMARLPGVESYQFVVSRFVGKNGEILLHTDIEDWRKFRQVPIAPTLANMLLDRKRYLREVYGLSDRELRDMPIVLPRSREKLLGQGIEIGHCSPDTANRACRELIERAEIPEQLLLLPGDQKDVLTDIYKYQGDIFQSNFKYWANHACGLTRGELCYVLGNSPPDTFSKHYCDYTNDLIQYAMAHKLERWAGTLVGREDIPPRSETETLAGTATETAEPSNGNAACMDMVFDIRESSGTLMLEMEQEFGHWGTYTIYRQEGSI